MLVVVLILGCCTLEDSRPNQWWSGEGVKLSTRYHTANTTNPWSVITMDGVVVQQTTSGAPYDKPIGAELAARVKWMANGKKASILGDDGADIPMASATCGGSGKGDSCFGTIYRDSGQEFIRCHYYGRYKAKVFLASDWRTFHVCA